MNHAMNQSGVLGASTGYAGDRIPQDAARPLEVPRQLEMLERNITGLRQGLDTLEDRLGTSILRQQPPKSEGPGGPVPVPSTPLARSLDEFNCGLAALNDRVQSLIARLEV
jgi:hypothetical protein